MAKKSGIMEHNDVMDKALSDETFVVGDGQAIIQFSTDARKKRDTAHGTIMVTGSKTDEGIALWGHDNCLPQNREILISNNNIVPQLIATKRNIILGTGELAAYKTVIEKGKKRHEMIMMPKDVKSFLEDNEIETEYLPLQAKNLIIHGNIFGEGGAGRQSKSSQLWSLKAHDAKYVRAGLQNSSGVIDNYYISNTWNKQQKNPIAKQKIARIPAYKKGETQPKFIMQSADKLLGGPYYFWPHWEGAWTWIEVANCIPNFHYSNIENGYNIRYLIKVPSDYFSRMLSDKQRESEKRALYEKAKRREFKKAMDDLFQGAKNSGKAMITMKYLYQTVQKQWEGIEIEAIEVNLQDEAMLKLFETTNSANTSSHGTPPALAGIATGAKMTSGSEIRNLFNYYQAVAANVPRKILLKQIMMQIKTFYPDPDFKLGFIDVELATTDKEPNGKAEKPIDSTENPS